MQLPTWTCAKRNRNPSLANWSICGVIPASLQPNAPTESALMSSVVMISRFGRSALARIADGRTQAIRTNIFGRFITHWSHEGLGELLAVGFGSHGKNTDGH